MRMISRFISIVIAIILLAFLVWFVVSNPQKVTYNLNHLGTVADFAGSSGLVGQNGYVLPAWGWGLIFGIGGFIFGVVVTILSGGPRRSKRRKLKRELRSTKKELSAREKEVADIRGISSDVDPVALIKK